MTTTHHLPTDAIEHAVAAAGRSPADVGTIEMIVARPGIGERTPLDEGHVDVGVGLAGDNYLERGNKYTPDGLAHPEAQLNLMNSRVVDVLAGGDRSRWSLAGDQFFVDIDVSVENLPVGTRLQLGTATIEVAAKPHNGCAKFSDRFGIDAARWVNQERHERRRGLNAMVVEPGTIRRGDPIRVVERGN